MSEPRIIVLLSFQLFFCGVNACCAEARTDVKVPIESLIAQVGSNNTRVQHKALRILADRGLAAQAAIPILVDALSTTNKETSELVCVALASMGPPVLPTLGKALDTTNRVARTNALRTIALLANLEEIQDPAKWTKVFQPLYISVIRPSLLRALSDPDLDWRIEAICFLCQTQEKSVLRKVMRIATGDPSRAAQRAALESLGHYRRESRTVVRFLTSIIRRDYKDSEISSAAFVGLEYLGALAENGYLDLLESSDEAVLLLTIRACANCELESKKLVNYLVRFLRSRSIAIKLATANTLRRLDSSTSVVRGGLRHALGDPVIDVRFAVVAAMQTIDPTNLDAIRVLARIAQTARTSESWHTAVHMLFQYGSMARPARKIIERGISDPERVGIAGTALWKILSEHEFRSKCLPLLLLEFETATSENHVVSLARVFRQVGKHAASVSPAIVAHLAVTSEETQEELLDALLAVNPTYALALPALRKIAKSSRSSTLQRKAWKLINQISRQKKP